MEAYYKLHEIMMINICEISFDSRSKTRMGSARCWRLAYMTLSSCYFQIPSQCYSPRQLDFYLVRFHSVAALVWQFRL